MKLHSTTSFFSMGKTTKVAKSAQAAAAIGNAPTYNAQPTLSSRKPKGLVQVISPERPKRASTCKIIGLEGNLAALFFKKLPIDDAFFNPLKDVIEANA